MLSRFSYKVAVRACAGTSVRRSMTTLNELATADDAWRKSCFSGLDFSINDEASVYDAVQKLAGFNVGCLVTVDDEGTLTGVVSERDYVCKIALLGRTSKETKVKQISTKAPNLVTAKPTDSVEDCMARMLSKGECARISDVLVATLATERSRQLREAGTPL